MTNINILILAGLAGLATLVGVFFGSLFRKTKKNIIFSASFAASLMILISVFELIPTALKDLDIRSLFFWVMLGISSIWLANWVIPHLHSMKEIKKRKDRSMMRMSYLIAAGLILHDFPEGFAVPSSFRYSESLGLLVVIIAFIHNIPEGYIMTISQSKASGRKFYYRAAAFSLLATFLGAILGIKLLASFQKLNPIFLSLAAGAMLFIAIHELLPESFRYKDIKTFSWGIGTAGLVYFAIGLF
jgi:zinc transporter, ZIP family